MASLKKADKPFSPEALLLILKHICMVEVGASLKVAFSGGLDSTVLLHTLNKLKAQQQWQLSAVYVDHGLHTDSAQWQQRCQHVCQQQKIPFIAKSITVDKTSSEGIEANARRQRYRALAEELDKGEYLLTAHHLNDQAETLLLQLLRGSGLHGMASMEPKRKWRHGYLLRPLLSFKRQALQEYAEQQQLQWIDDSSNQEQQFSRNYLRHTIMPLLQQRWPQADAALSRAANHACDAVAVLDQLAAADFRQCSLLSGCGLCISSLLALPVARQRIVLRYWLRQQHIDYPSTKKMAEILRFLQYKPAANQAEVGWQSVRMYRYRDQLVVFNNPPASPSTLHLPWQPQGPAIKIPGIGWRLSGNTCQGQGLALAKLQQHAVTVRLRQGGERCTLPGRKHRSELKKLLQNAGIPPWERPWLPLIYVDEDLAAVADLWVCAPFQTGPDETGVVPVVERAH